MPPKSNKKRILIAFLTETFGGAEANGLAVARAVAQTDDLEAHAAFPDITATSNLRALFRQADVHCHDYRVPHLPGPERLKRPFAIALAVAVVSSLVMLRRVRPDLVYVVLAGPLACTPLRIACALRRIPVLGASQLTPPVQWAPVARRTRLYRWLQRRGHRLVALCEHNREWLKHAFALGDADISLIYNGVPEHYPTAEDTARARVQVRDSLGLPQDAVLLLTVGRLGPQKGHELLIPILDAIVDQFPSAHFVWIGEGEKRDALEAASATLRHRDHLHLPGWVSNVPDWLHASDLFVFPTYYEGLPRAVMEALPAGIPVIASAVSSIPEIIEDGVSGVLVSAHDANEWKARIVWALEHPEDCARLGRAAQARAQRFTEERMLRETVELIRSHWNETARAALGPK